MNSQFNGVLVQIRDALFEDVAWGPEVPEPPEDTHVTSSGGVGGADNISDANDYLDQYLVGVVDSLYDYYGIEPDEALDLVFEVAANMEEDGLLPPMPEDDADEAAIAQWLGAAKSAGFHHEVLAAAEES